MNVLKSIEKKIEGVVASTFGRAFKSSVQPVEIAHKLAKEMGDHKTVSVARVYVPNEFEVYLSPNDYGQMHSIEESLSEDFSTYLMAFAQREGWTLVGRPRIEFKSDDELHLGEFGIATRTVTEPEQKQIVPEAAPLGMSSTVVYQPPAPVVAPAGAGAGHATEPQELCGVLRMGSQEYDLKTDATVLGRNKQCDVVVADPNVSRRHAEIRREGQHYVILDLNSTNGVQVNGRDVQRAVLAHGDRITVGASHLRFELRPC